MPAKAGIYSFLDSRLRGNDNYIKYLMVN